MSNRMDNNNDQSRGKKIFVGGLFPELTEDEFKNYFEKFGRIIDAVVIRDNVNNRPRGFGFVTFESVESVDSVLQKKFHELNGKNVEVKRAIPKAENCNGRISNARGGQSPVPYSNVPPSYPYYGSGSNVHPYVAPYPPYGVDLYGSNNYGQGVDLHGSNTYGQGVDLYGSNTYGNWYPPSFTHTPSRGAMYNPNFVGTYPPPHRNSMINPTYPIKIFSDTVARSGVADTRSVEMIKPPPKRSVQIEPPPGKRELSADAVPFKIKDKA